MAGVTVDRPESMNLLGLLMRGLLEENLRVPANARAAARMRGEVAVEAGGMEVTLRFADGGITVLPGASGRPRARVRGGMQDLLSMVTGGGLVGPVLAGRVRIGGNPFVLLRMLPLIRATPAARPSS
jgi:hypothetical protein